MASKDEFDWDGVKRTIEEAAEKFKAAFEPLGRMLNSQAALGNIMNGDLDGAVRILRNMEIDDVRFLSVTASALAAMADEELSKRPA